MHKQFLAAFAALAGLSMGAVAQTPAPAQAPAQTLAPTCAAPTIAATVDLVPVAGSAQMTVPVEINGTQEQFLLDIGTDHTEIAPSAAAALKLPGANGSTDALLNSSGFSLGNGQFQNFNNGMQMQAPMYDVNGSRSAQDYAQRVRVSSFTIGGATGHNLQLIIANDKEMGTPSEPWAGRMTGDMLAQYDIDFDFGGKKLRFMSAANCTDLKQVAYWAHSEVAVIPLKLTGGKMTVPVTIAGHTMDAVIETGAAHTAMRRGVAEDLGLDPGSADTPPDGDVRDGLGERVYVHTFPQISFGGVTAQNVPVLIQTNSMVHRINRAPILGSRATFASDPSQRVPDLAIGMDVLSQLHIYAAFGENELYVTAAK